MNGTPRTSSLAPIVLLTLTLGGCAKKDADTLQDSATAQPESAAAAAAPTAPGTSGFDINTVPVVTPQLEAFPYFSLMDGYRRAQKTMARDDNKDVAFDRYEFFDGTKIIPVEGRLATIDAQGQGASAIQIMRTYESLVTGLGGVKVFEGTAKNLEELGLKFADERHRNSTWDDDQLGVYVLRLPDREVWVEAYISTYPTQVGHYYLTVVERKALEVKASLLPAEAMKKEIDAKGHVALYINFDFDKANIRSESEPIVGEIVKLLKNDASLKLTVEGHTDNVGAPAYNRRLSDDRAKTVVAAVIAGGIDAARLNGVGYGQDKPIADNTDDAGRAKNRRVELVKRN